MKSGRILLEASPIHLDLGKVKEDLLSVSFSLAWTFLTFRLKFIPSDSWCTRDTRSPCVELVPIVSSILYSLQINLNSKLNILSHSFFSKKRYSRVSSRLCSHRYLPQTVGEDWEVSATLFWRIRHKPCHNFTRNSPRFTGSYRFEWRGDWKV